MSGKIPHTSTLSMEKTLYPSPFYVIAASLPFLFQCIQRGQSARELFGRDPKSFQGRVGAPDNIGVQRRKDKRH